MVRCGLPFQEPAFLLHGLPVSDECIPNFAAGCPQECLKLARVWDVCGLLSLFVEPVRPGHGVFHAFKGFSKGRLVTEGDPTFPNGMWTDPPKCCHRALSLWRSRHVLRGSVTDRRDFYHQAHVTPERARSNMLPFSYPVACFEDTHAYESLKASCLKPTFWPQRSCW